MHAAAVAAEALAPLATAAPARPAPGPAPEGDFSSPPPLGPKPTAARNAPFDPTDAPVVDRTATSTTWRRPDGTFTTRLHSSPVRVFDRGGGWRDLDPTFVADGPIARTAALPFDLTLRRATDPDAIAVGRDGWSVGFSLEGASPVQPALEGPRATFRDISPGVDLVEVATAVGVKGSLVVADAPDLSRPIVYRFGLKLSGVTAEPLPSGEIGLRDATRKLVAWIPQGEMWDARGAPLRGFGARVDIGLGSSARGTPVLEVRPDMTWLRDPSRVWPVTIDPSLYLGTNSGNSQIDAYIGSAIPNRNWDGLAQYDTNVGHFLDLVGVAGAYGEFYTFQQFDLGAIAGNNRRILNATWTGWAWDYGGPATLHPKIASWSVTPGRSDFLTWNNQPNHIPNQKATTTIDGDGIVRADVRQWVQNWADGTWRNYGFSADTEGRDWLVKWAAQEDTPLTRPYIDVTWAPSPSVPLAPANDAVLMDPTPALTSRSVSDPAGAAQYWYRIGTQNDTADAVVESGWLNTPSFTVPSGVLQDGMRYYWQVFTRLASDPTIITYADTEVRRFRIDLRLGTPAASPIEGAGGVAVNLATGNLHLSVTGPSYATVGGGVGVNYVYDSKAPAGSGLTGKYYASLADFGADNAVMARLDPQVSFNWGTRSPIGSIPSDGFFARWTGYLTVPAAGDWRFGAWVDDGVRIYIDDWPVLDAWTEHPYTFVESGPVSMGTQPRRIRIEYYEQTGAAAIQFTLRTATDTNTAKPVPSSWLSDNRDVLPRGWNLSVAGSIGLRYDHATVTYPQIVLHRADGGTEMYERTDLDDPASGYRPRYGAPATIVPLIYGVVKVRSSDGFTYTFHPSGHIMGAPEAPTDVGNPATAVPVYNATTRQLSALKDPATSRQLTFAYASGSSSGCATPPAGFDAASAVVGMLCRVNYWNGTRTDLYYKSGRLARMVDPGGAVTDFGYDTDGRITQIRSPLAADTIAAGLVPNDPSWNTLVSYDGAGRVAQVKAPLPAPGATARVTRTFTYPSSGQTRVQSSGISGDLRTVTFDGAGRVLTDTNATGQQTTYVWDQAKDLLLATKNRATDGQELQTSTIYDAFDRPRDVYGPAPATWFDPATRTPRSSYTSRVPRTTTVPDGGLQGLEAQYWNSDSFGGSIVARGFRNGAKPLEANWGTSSPASGVTSDHFTVRFSGGIDVPSTSSSW